MLQNPQQNKQQSQQTKNKFEDDDDRVIADMSLVQRRTAFIPEKIRREAKLKEQAMRSNPQMTNALDEMDAGTTKWAILGMLKAALLVGGAYILGLGAFILLLYLGFKYFG